MHIACFPFKVIFALVPPPGMAGGWLTFVIALALIGLLTAIIGDLAGIFGCLIGLKPEVHSIIHHQLHLTIKEVGICR